MKRRIHLILIAALIISCLSSCGNRIEETSNVAQKPEIEAAISDGGEVLAWCLAYDIQELLGTEPFRAYQIPDTMPVYTNKYATDGAGVPLQPAGPDIMMKIGKDIVQALNGKTLDSGFYSTTDGHLNIRCEKTGIEVNSDETVFITFGEEYPLPMKLQNRNQDYQEALDYAIDVLEPLLKYWNIENPDKEIVHDYTFAGEKQFNCYLAVEDDDKGSLEVNFLDGYLSSVRWRPNPMTEEGILDEYQTISYDEAEALLLKGQYYSIVPLDGPVEKREIAGAVIGYKVQCYDKVFLPFYAFYVDITDRKEAATPEESRKLGLRDYATYIIPAIEAEYLDEFPEIVVHFN